MRRSYLVALLVFALAVRLAGIERPLVGPFATKNIVYAMIARNWAEGRSTWAFPTLDCLKGGSRSLHMLEFPVDAYFAGAAWRCCGGSLDAWGRGLSALFSVGSVALLFDFMRRRHGPLAALAAATALAIAPVSMIYGQCFMLEASLLLFTVATFAALDRWLDQKRVVWLVLLGASLSLMLLTKIYMLVMLLPLMAMIVTAGAKGLSRGQRLLAAAVLGLALLPAAAWYFHAWNVAAPDGPWAARIFYSVRDSAEVHRPPHPLLWKPAFYGHVLSDLWGVVLTPVGLLLLAAGFFHRAWRRYGWWLLAAAVLVLLLPRKFLEMNYYWMPLLPLFCILIGLGVQTLVERRVLGGRSLLAVLGVAVLLSARYAVGPMWRTPLEDRGVVAAGKAVDRLAARDELVITMHGTTLDLLYYCRRPGWAIDPQAADVKAKVEGCVRQGARWLVIAGADAAPAAPAAVAAHAVTRGDGFAVFDLSNR